MFSSRNIGRSTRSTFYSKGRHIDNFPKARIKIIKLILGSANHSLSDFTAWDRVESWRTSRSCLIKYYACLCNKLSYITKSKTQ